MTDTGFSQAYRALSFVEFVIGAAIVVGHNVFHVVPNEVPILAVLGVLSIRLREGNWAAIGLGVRNRGGRRSRSGSPPP